MSGIFITPEDTFDVTVFYKEDGKKVEIVKDAGEGIASLKLTFRRPSFGVVQNILRQSTTVSAESGLPVVNYLQMQNSVLYSLVASWDVKDAAGKAVAINNDRISELRPEIARAIIDGMYEQLGPGGIV